MHTWVIDGHNHLGGPDAGDGRSQSAAELIAAMDRAGIDRAVVFPFNTPGADGSFRAANDVIEQAVRAYPDRLIGFGRVDPNAGAKAVAEVERCVNQLGLRGLKLHPKAQGFGLSDSGLRAVVAKAAELGAAVVFDSGTAACPWPDVAALAGDFPTVPLIMAHLRGRGWAEVAAARRNIYLGTTGVRQTDRILAAIELVGADRLISGSDTPYLSLEAEARKIETLPISGEDTAKIRGDNLVRILGL